MVGENLEQVIENPTRKAISPTLQWPGANHKLGPVAFGEPGRLTFSHHSK